MKFTVDRANWRFGGQSEYTNKNGLTRLLNSQGKMCCLGFCSIQLGYKPEDIYGIINFATKQKYLNFIM